MSCFPLLTSKRNTKLIYTPYLAVHRRNLTVLIGSFGPSAAYILDNPEPDKHDGKALIVNISQIILGEPGKYPLTQVNDYYENNPNEVDWYNE